MDGPSVVILSLFYLRGEKASRQDDKKENQGSGALEKRFSYWV
jgi:hypothetical protein